MILLYDCGWTAWELRDSLFDIHLLSPYQASYFMSGYYDAQQAEMI